MVIDKLRIKYKLSFDKNKMIRPSVYNVYRCPEGLRDVKERIIEPFELKKVGSWSEVVTFGWKEFEGTFTYFYGQMAKSFACDWSMFMIEYNPNKVEFPFFIYQFLRNNYASVYEIVSMDVAFDFRSIPVSRFVFDTFGQSETMTYGTVGGSCTRYLHPKSNNGRCKIYDKEAERAGKPDAERYKGVTRVEFTFHQVGFLLNKTYERSEFKRLEEMLSDIEAVKYPVGTREASRDGLKDYVCDMLDMIVDLSSIEKAVQVIRSMSINWRPKYKRYIMEQNKLQPVFSDGVVAFSLELSKALDRCHFFRENIGYLDAHCEKMVAGTDEESEDVAARVFRQVEQQELLDQLHRFEQDL